MQNLFEFRRRRTRLEAEVYRRILISVAAYCYEIEFDHPQVMSDHEFDTECRRVDPTIKTGRPILDDFFSNPEVSAKKFRPHTGSWIYNHPELHKVKQLYYAHYAPGARA